MLQIKRYLATILLCITSIARAQISDGTIKIGILTDMSGPYSGMGGQGSVVAANMAIDDCLKAECKGLKIEIISADHQNKADIASAKAREWITRDKVDVLADITNSAVALAVQKMIKEIGGIGLYSGSGTTRLTNEDCASNGFHWMFDSYSSASGTAAALTRQGSKSWYFVTVDYAFGHSLEKEAGEVVRANGGSVLGNVRHPLNSNDFSSFLLQAQASKAQVIGLANAGQDTVNAVKTAREFGISDKGQQVAAMLLFITDVHAIGLNTAQGLIFSDGFYWNLNDQTRAFATRFENLHKGFKPTMVQAGVYSSVLHYLKTVALAKTDDWKIISQKIRELPIQDPIMQNATIRPDGRVTHDMYLFQVKKPGESKGPWDYYNLIATIPAQIAFKPLEESSCPLVKK